MTKNPVHKIIVETDEPPKLVESSSLPVKCIYSGQVVVPANKMPSGIKHVFEAGEIKNVSVADRKALLALTYPREACCGNPQPPGPGKYFTAP